MTERCLERERTTALAEALLAPRLCHRRSVRESPLTRFDWYVEGLLTTKSLGLVLEVGLEPEKANESRNETVEE
jgi:hypothetical protein